MITKYNISQNSIANKGKSRCDDFMLWKEPLDENILVAIVCDGVSTTACDWLASKTACENFINHFIENKQIIDFEQRISKSLQSVNQDIMLIDGQCKGMSCTLVAIIWQMNSDFLWYFWAGDSRIYLFDNTIVKQITKDHTKPIKMRKQDGKLLTVNGSVIIREGLTNALGVSHFKPEICKIDFYENNSVLICSDGFYQCFPELEEKIANVCVSNNIVENFNDLFVKITDNRDDDCAAIILRRTAKISSEINIDALFIKNQDFRALNISINSIAEIIETKLLQAFKSKDSEYSNSLLNYIKYYQIDYSKKQLGYFINKMKEFDFLNGKIYQEFMSLMKKAN